MNISKYLDREPAEGVSLEYKSKEVIHKPEGDDLAGVDRLLKQIVAMTHSEGGHIFIGVEAADEKPVSLQNVEEADYVDLQKRLKRKARKFASHQLPYEIERKQYEGKTFDDCWLVHVEVAPSERLFGLNFDKHCYPYRLGDGTFYMDGHEVTRFVKHGHRPADTKAESQSPDIAEQLQDISSISDPVHGSQPYHFSEISDEQTGFQMWTFHPQMLLFGDPFLARTYQKYIDFEEFKAILTQAAKHLQVDLYDGSFSIAQRNCQWTGYGAKNLVQALEQQEDRYDTEEFEIDAHHSEALHFVADMHAGYLSIKMEPRVRGRSDDFEMRRFEMTFVLEGVPLDTRRINTFLDKVDLELRPGHSFDREATTIPGKGLSLSPIQQLEYQRTSDSEWISAIVCENPFYSEDKGSDFPNIEEKWQSLTNIQRVICKLRGTHHKHRDVAYKLNRVRIDDLREVTPGFECGNASFIGEFEETN
jgi:hypothetical protein